MTKQIFKVPGPLGIKTNFLSKLPAMAKGKYGVRTLMLEPPETVHSRATELNILTALVIKYNWSESEKD